MDDDRFAMQKTFGNVIEFGSSTYIAVDFLNSSRRWQDVRCNGSETEIETESFGCYQIC